MNLRDVIIKSSSLNDDLVIYAKRVDGQLLPTSEAVLFALTEDEEAMKTDEFASRNCPGFSYCIEIFLLNELLEDLEARSENTTTDEVVERVIYYLENDAYLEENRRSKLP